MKLSSVLLPVLSSIALSATAASPLVVYDVSASGASGNLEGTQKGITVNLPGGSWYVGGGWEWDNVTADGSRISLGEEHANACLPIESVGDYICPNVLTLTATLYHHQGKGGIGFWPEPTPRSTYYDVEGESQLIRYNATVGFSGILFDQARNGGDFVDRPTTLQLVENGATVGTAILVNISSNKFDTLSFSVNLVTGELLGVFLNDEPVTGFPVTSAFTASAAKYAGLVSWNGGRTESQSFSVTEASLSNVPEVFADSAVSGYTNTLLQANASARASLSHEPLPVSVLSFDGGDAYTFADGVFSWTPATAGVYTVTFQAALGDQTAEASTVFTVIEPPEVDTSVIYVVDATNGESGDPDGTPLCIITNLPEAVWSVAGGWDWSNVSANGSRISLGNEHAGICLPAFSTNFYIRPATFTITATLHHEQGSGGIGFWDVPPLRSGKYDDGEGGTVTRNYKATVGFTGLLLNQKEKKLQVAEGGSAKGSVNVTVSGNSYDELSYTVDTTTGELLFVFLNGEQILGLSSTAFTEAATKYAGVISWSGGRTDFTSFSLTEGRFPPVVPILYTEYQATNDFVGHSFSVAVSAVNPNTMEDVPVELVSFDGPDNRVLADGVFSWTSTATGTFTAVFRAAIGDESVEKSVAFTVKPVVPVLVPERSALAAYVGDTVAFDVTATDPDTGTNVLVAVTAFDGGAYTYADGTFRWVPAATGTYTAAFRTEIATPFGTESASTNVVVQVYNHPAPMGSCTPIYKTDLTGVASGTKYAGTTWTNAETRTSAGLVVNQPGAVWEWGSGFNWATPDTSSTSYNLGNEKACVLLPLTSTNSYVKPRKIKVEVTFESISGMCLAGFWSANPFLATGGDRNVYSGFTGFRFHARKGTLQLYANGAAQGELLTIPFLDPKGEYTLSFLVDTEKGTVSYVTWEGFLAGEFDTTAFTDAATAYVGVGSGDNDGVDARGRFSYLEVSTPLPESTLILLR